MRVILFNYEPLFHTLREGEQVKKKKVPSNIGDLLTAIGLAFWIMDDGGLGSNGLAPPGARINVTY